MYNKPNDERNTKDLVAIVRGMVALTKCPGGRIVPKGYVCVHCGVDYTTRENEGFCGQPVREDGYTTFDAAVARRTMLEGEAEYGED